MRTRHLTVRFPSPFRLPGVDNVQAPDSYAVDVDEEPIEGLSWTAHHRVAAYIHLPALSANRPTSQLVAMDLSQLDAVLALTETPTQQLPTAAAAAMED